LPEGAARNSKLIAPAVGSAQHPLQMLLSFLSTSLFSAASAASPESDGALADPVVVVLGDLPPDGYAVPKELVPGVLADFAEFPAPLESFTELPRPPAFAGPLGTPVTAAEPAPAEPAFGVPFGLTPAGGPLEAPLAEPLPELAPPLLPLWPSATAGESNMATIATLANEPIGDPSCCLQRAGGGDSSLKVRRAPQRNAQGFPDILPPFR
jgi:hypothetical protein